MPSRPNVKRLARRQRFEGLAAALRYDDWALLRDGGYVDLGMVVRRDAVRALAASDDPRAAEAISRALNDGAVAVRLAAVAALRERREPVIAPALANAYLSSYANGDEATRSAALDALGADPISTAAPVVRAVVERGGDGLLDESEQGLLRALAASGEQAAQLTVAALVDALDHERPIAQERAVQGLVGLGSDSVPALIEAMDDERRRAGAAVALGRCGDGRAVEALIGLLVDGDPAVRSAAAETLGDLRDPRSAEALLVAARDKSHETRVAAASALNRLGSAGLLVEIAGVSRWAMKGEPADDWSPTLPTGSSPAATSPTYSLTSPSANADRRVQGENGPTRLALVLKRLDRALGVTSALEEQSYEESPPEEAQSAPSRAEQSDEESPPQEARPARPPAAGPDGAYPQVTQPASPHWAPAGRSHSEGTQPRWPQTNEPHFAEEQSEAPAAEPRPPPADPPPVPAAYADTVGSEPKVASRTRRVRPWAIIGLVLGVLVVAAGVAVALILPVASKKTGNKTILTTPAGLPATPTHRHRKRAGPLRAAVASQPTTVKLQLVPTRQVYVCLVDGTGRELIRGVIFSAGQTIPTETAPEMRLTLGNASVQMKVNGSVVDVASSPSLGFLLKPGRRSLLPLGQQPTCTGA